MDRSPLPILFASLVDHPLRARFVELRPHVGIHSKALEEAQEILIRCGAVSYCIHQLLERHKLAKGIFGKLEIEQLEVLEKVLNDVVQPVFRLFQEGDASISGEALAAYTG
ncbi:MAG TPA: hypothetical protein PLF42_01115, partial [Anaerolineales bacterium]|nr:hypothetical protein [Anaerolineales bacterium]